MASLSLFQNECPLKGLAVVASDLPKLSNKIAYREWNRMEKKLMVTAESVNSWKALSLDVKLLQRLSLLLFEDPLALCRIVKVGSFADLGFFF